LFAGSWSGPFGLFIQFSFKTGYGREIELELLQKDCTTPITDSPFLLESSIFRAGISMTERIHAFSWSPKPELIMSNSIFNHQTGNIGICAVAHLVNSELKYEEVFQIMYQPRGPFKFMNSRTRRNDIVANYIVKVDLVDKVNSKLLQSDCSSSIQDTAISVGLYSWNWDEQYNYTSFKYTLDPETVRDSVIFNGDTSSIEVCHIVWLGNSKKRTSKSSRFHLVHRECLLACLETRTS
jgi:hypothetical protein